MPIDVFAFKKSLQTEINQVFTNGKTCTKSAFCQARKKLKLCFFQDFFKRLGSKAKPVPRFWLKLMGLNACYRLAFLLFVDETLVFIEFCNCLTECFCVGLCDSVFKIFRREGDF
jgi:hypothetical protein